LVGLLMAESLGCVAWAMQGRLRKVVTTSASARHTSLWPPTRGIAISNCSFSDRYILLLDPNGKVAISSCDSVGWG